MSNETPNTSKSFNKIKINDKKVEVHFTTHLILPEDQGVRNIKIPIESDVKPHKDFFDAFQELKKYAIGYMELSVFKGAIDAKILDSHIVTTLSITEDQDTVKIMISMNKYLKGGKCYSVTSPLIDIYNEDFSELKKLQKCYDKVIAEAKLYLEGKNGELQLSFSFEKAA